MKKFLAVALVVVSSLTPGFTTINPVNPQPPAQQRAETREARIKRAMDALRAGRSVDASPGILAEARVWLERERRYHMARYGDI